MAELLHAVDAGGGGLVDQLRVPFGVDVGDHVAHTHRPGEGLGEARGG